MKKLKVAVLAFFDENQKILLGRRPSLESEIGDFWELVGGGIEEDEDSLVAIKREILEELFYELGESDNLNFIEEIHFENGEYNFEVHLYKANFPGLENFSDSDEVKVTNLKLFSLTEALELPLLPIAKTILTLISNKNLLKDSD